MADNRIRILLEAIDKVSAPLDKINDRFNTLGKTKGFKAFAQGVGLGIGVAAWNMVGQAASTALSSAIEGAKEEEVSIQKLTTALRANVPGWDGNTDAIERLLKSRMRLGFSDDEQRDSLARLTAATHDVNAALKVQRVAMDLARFKGISLADASDALIRVEAGQFRALKALGIQLPKNATATQALAAVEKVATGQAEDYARTNTGKLLVAQVKVNESLEQLGTEILPIVATLTSATADRVAMLADNFATLAGILPDVDEGLLDTAGSLLEFLNPFEIAPKVMKTTFDALDEFGVDTSKARDAAKQLGVDLGDGFDHSADAAENMRGRVDWALGNVGGSIVDLEDTSKDSLRDAADAFTKYKDSLVGDAHDAIDDAFDPIMAHDKLVADNAETSAARRIIASGKATKAEIRDAEKLITETTQDTAEQLVVLAEAGMTNSTAYKEGVKNLEKYIAKTSGPTKRHLQDVLTLIRQIEKAGKVIPLHFVIDAVTGTKHFGGLKAGGGPVDPRHFYVVGEKGPEVFVPNEAGTIMPQGATGGVRLPATSGGGGSTINLTYAPGYSTASPAEAQTFMRAIVPDLTRELRRQRIL